MDQKPHWDLKNSRYESYNQVSYNNDLQDDKSEVLQVSNDSSHNWNEEREGDKCEARKRWSYGSDTSVEGIESSQNRLCCSPVDELESLADSEIEGIIVNNTDESHESFEDYLQSSPIPSPSDENVMCNSDNKRNSKAHDVDTADDELIDYSKRYTTENSMLAVANKRVISSHVPRRNIIPNAVARNVPEKKSISSGSRSKVDPFGDYAETDLDQPTNYSLLYVEEDSDEDDEEEEESSKFQCNGRQQDTVKTYYTEGTPYETPNFSNSTSMSDLLCLEDPQEREDTTYRKQYSNERKHQVNNKKPVREIGDKNNSQESKHSVLAKIAESENQESSKKIEKSLTPPQSPTEQCDKVKDSKTVTFRSEDNYAQETPLMYSRCSSLDSLDEFEQHSIRDDGSVISDFSHRTSTAVSPSELPDSPTQTVPPSPRKLKQQNFYHQPTKLVRPNPILPTNQTHPEHSKVLLSQNHPQNHNHSSSKPRPIMDHDSIFEDGLVSFKEESMPRNKPHSATASVLSALTIEDEDGGDLCDNHDIINRIAAIKVRSSAAGMHQAPMQKHQCYNEHLDQSDTFIRRPQFNNILDRLTTENKYSRNNCLLDPFSREEIHNISIEEDNYEYSAYPEMKNNRHRDPYNENCLRNNSDNYSNRPLSRGSLAKREFSSLQIADLDDIIIADTLRIYCTEDTPLYISPYGSQSNLSALSALSISDENLSFYGEEDPRPYNGEMRTYGSDASSSISEDDVAGYDDRRIDVSPFDSQLNLDSFALLSIEEEDEEEEEDEADGSSGQEAGEETNDETDNSAKDDSCTEDINAFRKLSLEEFDYSEEDRKVFENCIKSGMLKVAKQRDD